MTMRTHSRSTSRRAWLSAALLAFPFAGALSAQLPSSSAAGFAMAGNYTALARGYEAQAWNPANLASPGRPFFSLGVGVVSGSLGLDPVDVTAFYKVRGTLVDSALRASWVKLVKQSGRQRINNEITTTPLALSVGPIALSLGVASATHVSLSPDAFEAVLFGNAGNNNGAAKALTFTGTDVSSNVFATGALSFALPLPVRLGPIPFQHFSVGLTGKYVVGGVAIARDAGSVGGTGGNIQVSFPMIAPRSALFSDSSRSGVPLLGSGVGADLGASWSAGPWKVGVMAENVFNTFKWDTAQFRFTSNAGVVDQSDTAGVNSTEQPFGAAPAALRNEILGQRFKPALNVGMAFNPTPFLTITGDFHKQLGGEEAISIGPAQRVGVGLELRILPFIPLRAGVASVTDGWQAGGGAGIRLLGYELGISGSIRRRGAASESGMMISVIGIGH